MKYNFNNAAVKIEKDRISVKIPVFSIDDCVYNDSIAYIASPLITGSSIYKLHPQRQNSLVAFNAEGRVLLSFKPGLFEDELSILQHFATTFPVK